MTAALLALMLLVLALLLVGASRATPSSRPLVSAALVLAAATAAASNVVAARRSRRTGREGAGAWALLGLACALSSLSELARLVSGHGAPVWPHPAAVVGSTAAWVAGALVGLAVVVLGQRRLGRATWLRAALDGLLVSGTVVALVWRWVPSAAADIPAGQLAAAIALPVVDVVVLAVLVALVRRSPAAARWPLRLGVGALLLELSADLTLALTSAGGEQHPGSRLDIAWLGASIIAAALPWIGSVEGVGTVSRRRAGAVAVFAPGALAGSGLVLLVLVRLRSGASLDPVVLVFIAVLALALTARQGLTVLENEALARELGRREEHFRSVVHSSRDVIFVVRPDGRVATCNPAVREVLGFPPDALVGLMATSLAHPEDRAQLLAGLASLGFVDGAAVPGRRTPARLDTVRVGCRVRSAEGGWRHTESMVARHPDGIVVNLRDVTERVAMEAVLAHSATHDELTGLANRALFEQRLREAIQGLDEAEVVPDVHAAGGPGEPVHPPAVLFLDLDGFKQVNDSRGHAAGDQLLVAAAGRIAAVTQGALAARFGGDEFAVLLTGPAAARAEKLGDRLVAALSQPFSVGSTEVVVAASVGVAHGAVGSDVGTVLRDADLAMYRAKAGGGGRTCRFLPEMHAELVHRLELESSLRRALDQQRLAVLYQPVVDLGTGEVAGVEALVRWRGRDDQLLTPAELISYAEDSGRIQALGRWVVEEAVRQAAHWWRAGRPLGVAVNLSAQQVVAPATLDTVRSALAAHRLPPGLLTLEVTESVLLGDLETAVQRLEALRALGVHIALDDFGTGYSSLAYLRRLPVDVLKVDRSFVTGIGTEPGLLALTSAVVRLGTDLGLTVVAEGIETMEQAAVLKALGVHRAQGFHFAGPLTADGMRTVLARSPFPVPDAGVIDLDAGRRPRKGATAVSYRGTAVSSS
ncbi:MAG: putative bifunctional diguanylate cyclase/phosphodiesterase [Motilibacteraceae bacterium]